MNSIWVARAIGSAVTSGFQNSTIEDQIRILTEENHKQNMIILGLFFTLVFTVFAFIVIIFTF